MSSATWKWYQTRIADFFRRVQGARVEEDVPVTITSKHTGTKRKRKIDVMVWLPVTIKLSEVIEVAMEFQIIVDAKHHDRPVDVGWVDRIKGMRDDIGAHAAIIMCPNGFTKGAEDRAKEVSLILRSATPDLLAMLRCMGYPTHEGCTSCQWRGELTWHKRRNEEVYRLGKCPMCGMKHVLCSDCVSVFGIDDFEEGKSLRCPGGCGSIYSVFEDPKCRIDFGYTDGLTVRLLTDAYNDPSRSLPARLVKGLIKNSKWQYSSGATPLTDLIDEGWMEWDAKKKNLVLTSEGVERVERFILEATEAMHY
jgi:hypothetical protein